MILIGAYRLECGSTHLVEVVGRRVDRRLDREAVLHMADAGGVSGCSFGGFALEKRAHAATEDGRRARYLHRDASGVEIGVAVQCVRSAAGYRLWQPGAPR